MEKTQKNVEEGGTPLERRGSKQESEYIGGVF